MSTLDLDQLVLVCRELESSPASLTDAQANAFFSEFSLERIFRALASAGSRDPVPLISDVLGRLLSTDLGASMLPGAMPYLEAASIAPLVPLRRLAAEQYGSLLIRAAAHNPEDRADGSELVESACLLLVRQMTSDPDTGVAAAAARALRQYGSASAAALGRLLAPGSAVAAALTAAATGRDAAVRMRVLALALELVASGGLACGESGAGLSNGHLPNHAASGPVAPSYDERLQLLRASGLLAPLLAQLSDASDPLACLAALQLLEDLMAGGSGGGGGDNGSDSSGVAAALAGIALPQLLNLVSDPMLADAALPLVAGIVRRSLPEALRPEAVAVAIGNGTAADVATVRAAAAPTTADDAAAAAAAEAWPSVLRAAPALLGAVRAVLDERGDASAAAEASGLDALGTLGQSRAGAQLALSDEALVQGLCERALGRCPHPEVRLAALHAVASLAGLERAGWERCRAAALLPAQCEEALRGGLFGASGLRRRPGEVVLGLLEQPFVEMRLAAYRFLAALSLRSWFATEVTTTPALLDRLTDPASESGAAACNWRHAAVAALWATVVAAARGELAGAAAAEAAPGTAAAGEVSYAATLAAAPLVERLRKAVQGGPYGSGGNGGGGGGAGPGAHDQHFVATRGGGGGV